LVGTILWRKLLGSSVNIDAGFHALEGPFKAVRNIPGRKMPGPSVNIDAGFAWSNGPIQSSRKHYRRETTGPIRELRYRPSLLRWADSKRSKTFLRGNYWAHPRPSMLVFARSNGPIQSNRKHYRKETTEPIRERRYRLSMLRWAHSKQSETIPTGGPFVSIDTGYSCSGGPIQSCRRHSREETTGPIRKHRCWLCMLG
jgi:hypothetical protein